MTIGNVLGVLIPDIGCFARSVVPRYSVTKPSESLVFDVPEKTINVNGVTSGRTERWLDRELKLWFLKTSVLTAVDNRYTTARLASLNVHGVHEAETVFGKTVVGYVVAWIGVSDAIPVFLPVVSWTCLWNGGGFFGV